MSFSIRYALTGPVASETESEIIDAASSLGSGRTWLSCEPPGLRNFDGILSGHSKPNFMPHPDDVASAQTEGLPDGNLNDLLEVLCQISRQFNVDFEISHEYSDGPVGFIRGGVCDEEVREQCEAFSELADDLLNMEGFDFEEDES